MNLRRAESLNDEPLFLRALADLASSHLSSFSDANSIETPSSEKGKHVWCQGPTSRQMQLRCPGCVNQTCGDAKRFFGGGEMKVGEDLMR